MYRNNIELRVLVNGRPVREYTHQGLTFIESRHGSQYVIKVKNDNATRVMVVVSVDGLDVITGKPADKTNKGYIVDAYSSTEIKGYRTSDNESVKFIFVSKDQSYVANAAPGDARNSGVIGIRVFEEKPEKVKVIEKIVEKHHWHNQPVPVWPKYPCDPWDPWNPWYPTYVQPPVIWSSTAGDVVSGSTTTYGATLNASDPAPVSTFMCSNLTDSGATLGAVKGMMAQNLPAPGVSTREVDHTALTANSFDAPINYDTFDTGTGWGERQTDKVRKEYFRQGKTLTELVLYYASTEALKALGIDLDSTAKITETPPKTPKAFGDSQRYCQPPRDWNG